MIVADQFHFCRYIYWALDDAKRSTKRVASV
ncbi:hypothetical protein [Fervidibacillus albus]